MDCLGIWLRIETWIKSWCCCRRIRVEGTPDRWSYASMGQCGQNVTRKGVGWEHKVEITAWAKHIRPGGLWEASSFPPTLDLSSVWMNEIWLTHRKTIWPPEEEWERGTGKSTPGRIAHSVLLYTKTCPAPNYEKMLTYLLLNMGLLERDRWIL